MSNISVCMIVKNEEKNIVGCLESIRKIADEIVVVDNGSTDFTKKILKNYDCVVLDGSDLELDYARNLYLEEAKFEWLFLIDADERFDQEDIEKLKKMVKEVDEDVWGIQLKNVQYLGSGKWSDAETLRIIRNNGNIKYNNSPIHASLAPSIYEKGKKIINSNIRLHHLDILISGRTINKRQRYRTLLEDICYKGSSKINADFYNLYRCFLALEYIAIKRYYEAEKLLVHSIENKTKYNYFAVSLLCQMYIEIGEYRKIEKYVNDEYNEILVSTEVLGNYLYMTNKNECIELYENEIIINPEKYSNYVNLAYLISDVDRNRAKKLLKELFFKNPFLKNSIVYLKGNTPNIFNVQSNILKPIDNILNLLEKLNLNELVKESRT